MAVIDITTRRPVGEAGSAAVGTPTETALQVVQGCVMMIVGKPGNEVEFWFEPNQAEKLGHELVRFAAYARRGGK
jgi:hypothetical protein